MKAIASARLFLIIFIGNLILGCSQPLASSPEESVLDNLNRRIEENDLVASSVVRSTNQYDVNGKFAKATAERFVGSMSKRSSATLHDYSAIGIKDPVTARYAKMVLRKVLEDESLTFDEVKFDAMNEKLNQYALSSAGVSQLLLDLEKGKSITLFQKKVIELELMALSKARNSAHAREICATFEYELKNSGVSDQQVGKLMLVNALTRNLMEVQDVELRAMMVEHQDEAMFRKAGLGAIVGLVIFLGSVIVAILECDAFDTDCTIALATAGLSGLILGVNYDGYNTYDPATCNLNGCYVTPLECVCP